MLLVAADQTLSATDQGFTYRHKPDSSAEARLDGLYVVRTSLSAEAMSAEDTVGAYKGVDPGGASVPR